MQAVGQKDEGAPESWESQIRRDEGIQNEHGLSNKISTTKYSLLSWLPLSLFEQFRRIANVYFLVTSIIMLIGFYAPEVFTSPLNPYSTIITFAFVLLVTSVKEGYEDLQRAKSDNLDNRGMVTVIRFENGEVVETTMQSQYVQSGDIVKLEGRCAVPVDLLLILTSNHADGNQCYIETSNIDGETNLKVREGPAALVKTVKDGVPRESLFRGHVEYEPPNRNIHNFIGALHLEVEENPIPLSAENVLLRSSLFSNTEWAYGIAVYVGQETKIQMNNRMVTSKMSKLEMYLNRAIIMLFVAQAILVTLSVASIYWLDFEATGKLPYVYPDGEGSVSVLPLYIEQWLVFFILYNNFIPISLYVTIEMVNLGQAMMIGNDLEMYEEDLDCPCMARSSNLCSELGMVMNVFSDKTGTLTRNEMKLVKFVCEDTAFTVPMEGSTGKKEDVLMALKKTGKGGLLYGFLKCLTLCHTVVREKDGKYRAESPDELALVEGVGPYDCFLQERGTTLMTCTILGEEGTYEVLAVNAFNSDRKRMSIIVKDVKTNEHFLFCKGADNIMMPLCTIDASMRTRLDKYLLDLACEGLRTLCISQKKMSDAEVKKFLADYNAAASSLTNRADKLADVAAALETDMTFLGITAIEDRLQDEVPEVIADLAQAGIITWMLTGDKEETAVNIGHSCNLLLSDTKTFFCTKMESSLTYTRRLEEIYNDIMANTEEGVGYKDNGAPTEIVFVMDGPSFRFFDEENTDMRKWILEIGKACRSVIACRLTPVQKQQLVGLVKRDSVPKATCLAIGDGANDVSMIREGNVGVGIFGKEGRQAANNADFAIGQFKYLRKLLLVHGRWNYVRQSQTFLYSMHKNIVITLTLFWFSYYTAVSGTSMYESWVYSVFNVVLGLPIVFFGIMDRDISASFALANPHTYMTGAKNVYLSVTCIGWWLFNACLYGVQLCLLYFLAFRDSFQYYGLFMMGTAIYTGLCLGLQAKVAFMHHQWAWVNWFVMGLSIFGMFAYYAALSSVTYDYVDDYYNEAQNLFGKAAFWLFDCITVPIYCVLIDAVCYYLRNAFVPSNEMVFTEMDNKVSFA